MNLPRLAVGFALGRSINHRSSSSARSFIPHHIKDSRRAAFLSSSSSSGSTHSSDQTYPVRVLDRINEKQEIGCWDDRIKLQGLWSNEEKGWQVPVEWKPTSFGIGLFATANVNAGEVLRVGVLGHNLFQFQCAADLEDFCSTDKQRINYVKDYLWGFYPQVDTDERGYPRTSQTTDNNNDTVLAPVEGSDDNDYEADDRFFGMWIPGNGLNHCTTPNTVYCESERGIDLVALTDISKGDEFFDDYRRHGLAPRFLKHWAEAHNVTLNFSGCNDFVKL